MELKARTSDAGGEEEWQDRQLDGDECLWAVVVAVVGVGCLVCSFTVIQRRRRPCRGVSE